MYKMKGEGCHLAIKLNGKDFFVDGTGIDDHGEAHIGQPIAFFLRLQD